jgi:hypothetical protein
MGNMIKRFTGNNQADQSMVQQPPLIQYGQPGAPMQQQQQQQQPSAQYGPPGVPMQQQMPPRYGQPASQMSPGYGQPVSQMPPGYGQSYPNVPPMPRNAGASPMSSSYESDMHLSSMVGLPPADVAQLRAEFYNYANPYGIIDRDGFRKLYVASLLNKTWQVIEREAETAFRNFDTNQTGGLDFHEYMMACARMTKGNPQSSMYHY